MTYRAGYRDDAPDGTLRRFDSAKIESDRVHGLALGHPAVVDGRTIFPSTVVGSAETPRLLVSGHNNPKLGKEIRGGARDGWPIFHLTLEERATCPRSCATWTTCYGNAMHRARRHRHDAGFLPRLDMEIADKAAAHSRGFLMRLHTLGDFYSVEYVRAWAALLEAHPALHVFGYTARRTDDPDIFSQAIAEEIDRTISLFGWGRFAVRTSSASVGPRQSVVVLEPTDGMIMCPAQTKASEACATCGLCWAPAVEQKAIGFLLHGMKRAGKRRRVALPNEMIAL